MRNIPAFQFRLERQTKENPVNTLLLLNRDLLQQLWELLGQLSEADYRKPHAASFEASIGDHIRHTLEHYQCFLEGLPDGKINYDHRRRENHLASDPVYAQRQIKRIDRALAELNGKNDRPLQIFSGEMGDAPAASSCSRELAFLLSHTVHHCALIRSHGQSLNLTLSDTFGMAPSTLTHLENKGT